MQQCPLTLAPAVPIGRSAWLLCLLANWLGAGNLSVSNSIFIRSAASRGGGEAPMVDGHRTMAMTRRRRSGPLEQR